MPASIIDAFDAMGHLTNDAAFGPQLHKAVALALVAPAHLQDRQLIGAYLEGERDLLHRLSNRYPEDIRRELLPHFQPHFAAHPDFGFLFETRERQIVLLATILWRTVAAESRALIGPAVADRIAEKSLADTPWEGLKVTLKDGIEYNPTRQRTMQDCVLFVSVLFERWLEITGAVVGDKPAAHAFERAYAQVAERYGWMATVKDLLGAMPLRVLADEKAKHLHELETETASQARGLRAADEGLRRQADRLQQTVDELQETRRQLEAASSAKSAFIDVVSHQFRTPLSSMRWNAEMLYDELARKDGVDPVHKEAISTIRAKSVYLIETLDRVFTMLEIDTGTLMLDKKPGFLWEVVQDVHDQHEKDLRAKGLNWTFKRAKDQLTEIRFDKVKLNLVLQIIIGNAIAYAKDSGAVSVDVHQSKANGKDYLVCAVSDDGLGIPKGDEKKFFDKFYRSKPAVLKVADGTGLGNYIVKHLIEAHHGYVIASSPGEGKGATVEFGLPLA